MSSDFAEACATRFSVVESYQILAAAARLRISYEPVGATVLFVEPTDVLAASTSGAFDYWNAVFVEACMHGPRMLLAILLSIDDALFPIEVQAEKLCLVQRIAQAEKVSLTPIS